MAQIWFGDLVYNIEHEINDEDQLVDFERKLNSFYEKWSGLVVKDAEEEEGTSLNEGKEDSVEDEDEGIVVLPEDYRKEDSVEATAGEPTFKPLIITEGKIAFNSELMDTWKDNEKLQAFIFQGGHWREQIISWGNEIVLHDDDIISEFTKELMFILGENGKLEFMLQAIADDGYENYSIWIGYNFNDNKLTIDSYATFYGEEDDDE